MFFYTLSGNYVPILNALKQTRRIEWTNGHIVFPIYENIEESFISSLKNFKEPVDFVQKGGLWKMNKENALKLQVEYVRCKHNF